MKKQIHTIISHCRTSKYADVYIAFVVAFSLFIQCVLFHWFAFHSVLIASLWKHPINFWSFYLSKLSIPLLISSFVFLFKRKIWPIYVSVLTNIWIIAELVYFRSTRIFIDAYSFLLLNNLHGFENSIWMYLDWSMLLFFIPTLLIAIAVYLFNNTKQNRILFAIALCMGFIINILSSNLIKQERASADKTIYLSPLSEQYINTCFSWNLVVDYTRETSVLYALTYDVKTLLLMPFQTVFRSNLTEQETNELKPFVQPYQKDINPSRPLILILVESLETWAVTPEITPNLCRFLDMHENILWAKQVKSQTKGGNSGDGQMILNTGLLPVALGAACNRFHSNTYPSLSELYTPTAMIQPGDLGTWSQLYMNKAYHIDTAFVNPQNIDALTFNTLDGIVGKYPYILTMTIASHTPFEAFANQYPADIPTDIPATMANYLNCLHYTDSCWGDFLCDIETDSILHKSTICLMGDHIVFNQEQRTNFQDYCDKNGLSFQPCKAYTTMVIYSPAIEQKTIIDSTTYQMDAYPTILYLIDCENYYWKGFGVNLFDAAARDTRPIEEREAYLLSDKVIQANWFETYLK